MPRTLSVALVAVTLLSATVVTAVFFDSAWIWPRAPLTCTVVVAPAETVTADGDKVSAATAGPAHSSAKSAVPVRSRARRRACKRNVIVRFM